MVLDLHTKVTDFIMFTRICVPNVNVHTKSVIMNNQKEEAATDCPKRTNRACFIAIEDINVWARKIH